MKTSLKKLRGLRGLKLKHAHQKDKRQTQPMTRFEEIAQADQDMQDIKDCYDRLLSAAAATTNSVYEFSESLKEIGDCVLEKTSLGDFEDEESVKVVLTLGKVQLQLQRLLDVYRSNISETITVPSESVQNELQIIEEMKSRSEEKRMLYEEALRKQDEKGKLISSKVDCFPSPHLQAASDEYDQEVNSWLFRMRSFRQGQSRCFLTQVARHHAAQLTFFKRAYLSLEEVEPYVKTVAKDHHIDYEFVGVEDDSGDDVGNDGDTDAGSSDCSELSFDHRQDHSRPNTKIPIKNVELFSPDNNTYAFRKEIKVASKSAPLFPDRRSDPFKPIQLRSSSARMHESYALPTPLELKRAVSARSKAGAPEKRYATLSSCDSYHRSQLDNNEFEKLSSNDVVSGPLLLDTNENIRCGFLQPQADTKNVKRYAVSGPLTGKHWRYKPVVTTKAPISSTGHQLLAGSLLHTPEGRPLSKSKLVSHISSPLISPPKISELHELPRPPPHLRPSPHYDYSHPSFPKATALSTSNEVMGFAAVSRLPTPPPLGRSYSIPTRSQIMEPIIREVPSLFSN